MVCTVNKSDKAAVYSASWINKPMRHKKQHKHEVSKRY